MDSLNRHSRRKTIPTAHQNGKSTGKCQPPSSRGCEFSGQGCDSSVSALTMNVDDSKTREGSRRTMANPWDVRLNDVEVMLEPGGSGRIPYQPLVQGLRVMLSVAAIEKLAQQGIAFASTKAPVE